VYDALSHPHNYPAASRECGPVSKATPYGVALVILEGDRGETWAVVLHSDP
jgi:hypothetical protein